MSIPLTHDIQCDKCGQWEHVFVKVYSAKKRARKIAKSRGWRRRRNAAGQAIDVCPVCAGQETLLEFQRRTRRDF